MSLQHIICSNGCIQIIKSRWLCHKSRYVWYIISPLRLVTDVVVTLPKLRTAATIGVLHLIFLAGYLGKVIVSGVCSVKPLWAIEPDILALTSSSLLEG